MFTRYCEGWDSGTARGKVHRAGCGEGLRASVSFERAPSRIATWSPAQKLVPSCCWTVSIELNLRPPPSLPPSGRSVSGSEYADPLSTQTFWWPALS